MAKEMLVVKVFIASPSDVVDEREIVRKVIGTWNANNSDSKGIVLVPVGWETHGTPSQQESAQKRINRKVLDDCDLLIGMFHTRLGTPTEDYPSGTVEEIERHTAAKRCHGIFF